jgi:hypothetical protein
VAGWQWQFDSGCGNLTVAVDGWQWQFDSGSVWVAVAGWQLGGTVAGWQLTIDRVAVAGWQWQGGRW